MSNVIPLNRQKFKGFFSYTNQDENGIEFEESVNFEMELEFNQGSFKGTTIDEETKDLFNEPITVEGFIEDEMINFVVTYPNNYYFDLEQNKLVVEKNKAYPGCEYLGSYNKDSNKFEGEWRLPIEQNNIGSLQTDYTELYDSGNWEMKRISEAQQAL